MKQDRSRTYAETVPDDLLAELVGLLPVGVFAPDDDGGLTLWNPAAERLTGWSG